MKWAPLLVLLGVCVLLLSELTISAVSLSVSPNLQQFFSGSSSVSLSCVEDGQTVDRWTVKRTRAGLTEDCGAAALGFGDFNAYSCILSDISQLDSAAYWCETSSRQRSDQINITVTEKHLILEVPALPVRTGSGVTLRCRQRNGDTVQGYFSIKGSFVGPKREHSITNTQQSDEGLYWCSTDEGGKSPPSFLRVRDPPKIIHYPPPAISPPPPPPQTPFPASPPVNSPLVSTLSIYHPDSFPQTPYPSSPPVNSPLTSTLSIHTPVTSPPPPPPPPPSLLVAVVASLVSGVLLVLVLCVLLFFCRKLKGGRGADLWSCGGDGCLRRSICLCFSGLFLLTATGVCVLLLMFFLTVSTGPPLLFSESVIRLFCHLVVFCPYCISTGLLLSICCSRKTPKKTTCLHGDDPA